MQSHSTVIPVLIASTYTAQMNTISSTCVYCMFLNLATSPVLLCSDRFQFHLPVHDSRTYSTQNFNDDWKVPCRPICPLLFCKTIGDKGTTTFRWNTNFPVPES